MTTVARTDFINNYLAQGNMNDVFTTIGDGNNVNSIFGGYDSTTANSSVSLFIGSLFNIGQNEDGTNSYTMNEVGKSVAGEDDVITKEELAALDTDEDGAVSLSEYNAQAEKLGIELNISQLLKLLFTNNEERAEIENNINAPDEAVAADETVPVAEAPVTEEAVAAETPAEEVPAEEAVAANTTTKNDEKDQARTKFIKILTGLTHLPLKKAIEIANKRFP